MLNAVESYSLFFNINDNRENDGNGLTKMY